MILAKENSNWSASPSMIVTRSRVSMKHFEEYRSKKMYKKRQISPKLCLFQIRVDTQSVRWKQIHVSKLWRSEHSTHVTRQLFPSTPIEPTPRHHLLQTVYKNTKLARCVMQTFGVVWTTTDLIVPRCGPEPPHWGRLKLSAVWSYVISWVWNSCFRQCSSLSRFFNN